MKTTNLFTFFLLVIFLATSCSIDDNIIDPGQKDTKFKAVITGAINSTIEFILPGGGVFDIYDGEYGIVAGCEYNSTDSYLLVTVNQLISNESSEAAVLMFYGTKSGEFSTGNYSPMSGGAYTSNVNDPEALYSASSSLISITKAELRNTLLGLETYWVDGTFEMTLIDNKTPPNEIQISGAFENVLLYGW